MAFQRVRSLTPFPSRPGKLEKPDEFLSGPLCGAVFVLSMAAGSCCVSDDSELGGLKQQAFIISVSLEQEPGCSLAGGLWLRGTVVKARPGLPSSEGSCCSWQPPQVLPGGWPETSALCHMGLFLGWLAAQQLGFPESKCVREGIPD